MEEGETLPSHNELLGLDAVWLLLSDDDNIREHLFLLLFFAGSFTGQKKKQNVGCVGRRLCENKKEKTPERLEQL